MNAHNRKNEIFELLTIYKKVSVNDLAKRFNVTTMTIRRDLNELETQGIVNLYYGGASLNEGNAIEKSFDLRESQESRIKYFIAYQASKYINDGDTIYIDGGSTCYNICHFLKNKKITVLTNSLRTVNLLKNCEDVKVIIAPGEYSKVQEIVASYATIEFISRYHLNKAFLSTSGIDLDNGVSIATEMEAQIKNKILQISDKKILLVDHTKFNQNFLVKHGMIDDFDIIITDNKIDEDSKNKLTKHNIQLDIVNI